MNPFNTKLLQNQTNFKMNLKFFLLQLLPSKF